MRVAIVLVLGACLLGGLAAWFARLKGHWSVDSAVWELMTREVARRGWQGLWVENLAREADPQGRFFPSFFFVRRGDRYHFSFQPAFALLSAPGYRLVGRPGLAVVPLASALLIGWLVAAGCHRLVPGSGWLGAAAALFLTPIPIYAVTVWNHLPSVALLTLGTLLAWWAGLHGGFRPIGMLGAGFSVGLALLFRNEAYLYGAALVLGWLMGSSQDRWRGAAFLTAGLVLGWCVQVGLNWHVYGSLLGPKAESVAARQAAGGLDLPYRLWNLYLFLAAPDFSAFLRGGFERGVVLFSPVVLAAILLAVPHGARRLTPVLVALWTVALATVATISGRTQVTGFFWVAPYLVLAFSHRPLTPLRRFLTTLALAFAAGVVWTASHGGFQWGPRYLLALYPVAVWLALDGWSAIPPSSRHRLRLPVAMLLLLALLAQAAGVDHADQGQWRATQALRTIRELRTRYVLVGLEIFAWGFAPAYGEKVLMSVGSQPELEDAVRGLARAGVPRFTYIPRSGLRFDRRVVERVDAGGRRYRVARDEARGDLRLVEYELVDS